MPLGQTLLPLARYKSHYKLQCHSFKYKCSLHKATTIATTILFLVSSMYADVSFSIRKLSAGRYSFLIPGTDHSGKAPSNELFKV